ncbi:MAG: hypothetical protein DRI57_09670 [Deltaproteobacteria bacterium]|nr:MAG: hypothetical protein DRI57_09670 [Deltaproteobacteria bacterium]
MFRDKVCTGTDESVIYTDTEINSDGKTGSTNMAALRASEWTDPEPRIIPMKETGFFPKNPLFSFNTSFLFRCTRHFTLKQKILFSQLDCTFFRFCDNRLNRSVNIKVI